MQTQSISIALPFAQPHPIKHTWMKQTHVDDTCLINGVVYHHDEWQHWHHGTSVDALLTASYPHKIITVGQTFQTQLKVKSIQLIDDMRYAGAFERHLLWYYIFES